MSKSPSTHRALRIVEAPGSRNRQPCLTMLMGPLPGRVFSLEPGVSLIGRAETSDLTFDDLGVSRQHARVRVDRAGETVIQDVGSTNGTWVNGEEVAIRSLVSGDKVRLGSSLVLRYERLDDLDIAFAEHLFLTSTTDALTGCRNRRYFEAELPRELAYAQRSGKALTVALLDVDNLKPVNDTWDITSATRCCRPWPRPFRTASAPTTRWPAGAATSSA